MKKKFTTLLLFSLVSIFLCWCDSENAKIENLEKSNSAENVISEISYLLWKTEKDVVKTWFYLSQWDIELPWFLVQNKELKYSDIKELKLWNYFDGWVAYQEWDWMREYYTQYLNDNVVCNIHWYTNADSAYLYSLVYSDENSEENYELADSILYESPYTIEVSCTQFTEQFPSPLEFNFSVSGEEPFWDADITPHNVHLSTAGWLVEDLYPNIMKKEWNKRIIEADNYYDELNFTIEIIKEDCIDWWKWNTHEYYVKLYNSDATFEWCADKKDPFIISQRQWKLSSFIDKTWIEYNGYIDPENLEYYLRTEWNLISLYVYNREETEISDEDKITNIILWKTDKGFETYWIGWDDIDDDTCEKYHLVEWLMDFGLFSQCPRG